MIRLLCEPGSPRLGELDAMEASDVDLKRDKITVARKMGTRSFPFGSKTGSAIDQHLGLCVKSEHVRSHALEAGVRVG